MLPRADEGPFAATLIPPGRPDGSREHARAPGVKLTRTLLVFGGLTLFMGLAAMNSQANLLFAVFGLMIGVLLVSWVMTRLVLRRLDVTRDLPPEAAVGRPATIVYRFHNQKRFWPSVAVALRELDGAGAFASQPRTFLVHAAAGNTAEIPADVLPLRRGVVALDRFQLSTSFPFGFVRRAFGYREPGTMLVYPPIGRLDPRLLARCKSAEHQGATLRPRMGGTDEFYGLKEYRGEDGPRSIYWRRSARTGQLVSRVMTKVAPPRVLLAVDTWTRNPTRDELARVEKAIAMAASLADAALGHGLAVGLVARGADRWVQLWPTDGKQQRRQVLTALAELPLNREHDPDGLLAAARELTQSQTTVVLCTPHEVDAALVERARGALVVLSTNRPATDEWFRFPAGLDFARAMPIEVERAVAREDNDDPVAAAMPTRVVATGNGRRHP